MSEQTNVEQHSLTGLLLTLTDRTLLVPNTAVAELIAWQEVDSIPGGVQRDGLIGRITWRGMQLPLLSFEVLAGGDAPDVTADTQIAIFNALDPSVGLSFFAVPLQGIPSSIQVDNELQSDSQASLRKGELQDVLLDGQQVYIPDLEGLEKGLLMSRLQQRF